MQNPIPFLVFLIVIGALLVWRWRTMDKIKKNGLEAVAEVSRMEIIEHVDSDGTNSEEINCYVTYQDSNGNTVEARLANPKRDMGKGRKMKIKYLPERLYDPVFIEYL